jgi:hypothetical protein
MAGQGAVDRARILQLLCEGRSVAAVGRLTGAGATAVARLRTDAGRAAAWYQDRVLRELPSRRVQIDVAPTFRLTEAAGSQRSIWTWLAIDPERRLIVSWLVGDRDGAVARRFLDDVAGRVARPLGLVVEDDAVRLDADADAADPIDDARLAGLYGGRPDPADAPAPAGGRVQVRDAARLPRAVRSRIETHAHGLALAALYGNFVHVHGDSTTPATAAGITKAPWALANLLDVLDMWQRLNTGPWYERLVVLPGG